MENEDLNNRITLAGMSQLMEHVRVLEFKLDQLSKILESKFQQDKMFGDWISEKDAMERTDLSRSTFLNLRKQGKLTTSSISGKSNYYRLSQIKEMLDENEKNR